MSGQSTRLLTVHYNDGSRRIALFPGLQADELSDVLCSTFFLQSGSVVGFETNDGVVIPISLACKNPEYLSDEMFLLVIEKDGSTSPKANTPPAPPVAPAAAKHVMPPAPPSSAEEQESDIDTMAASDQIVRFIAGLRQRKILTKEQADALEERLFDNNNLILAAYSVACAADDVKYFAEMCREMAIRLLTPEGIEIFEGQEEILDVAERLFAAQKIDKSKLTYLRHLILIRENSIAKIYEEYRSNREINALATSLYRLAYSPQAYDDYDSDEDEEVDQDDDDSQSEQENSPSKIAPADDYSILSAIISEMLKNDILSGAEASLLQKMALDENDYVVAAYEVFTSDNNLRELQDTLMRCAKLEMRRIQASHSEAATRRNIQQRESKYQDQYEDDEEDDDESEEDNSEEDYDEDEDSDEEYAADVDITGIDSFLKTDYYTLSSLLAAGGVTNKWIGAVPGAFIAVAFSAATRKVMSFGQARALCDLFQGGFDLVKASWEVFLVEKNFRDLVDTMIRIVRDLEFNESGEVMSSRGSSSSSTSDEGSTADAVDSAAAARQAGMESKKQALVDIEKAKLGLVKHSLELMVKQGMCSADGAESLFKRVLEGDKLVDAAINSYTTDRDVAEFLETLSILANHSPEDLDKLLRRGAARDAGVDVDAADDDDESAPEEDEENDEEEDGHLDRTQLDLLGATAQLSKNGILNQDGKMTLVKLISGRDKRLIAAHAVWQENRDEKDYIDTILRVMRAAQSSAAAEAPYEDSESGDENSGSNDDDIQDYDDDDAGIEMTAVPASASSQQPRRRVLDTSDMKQIIDSMAGANHLNSLQTRYLKLLLDKKDPNIVKIFDDYEENKQVLALVKALQGASLMSDGVDTRPTLDATVMDDEDTEIADEYDEEDEDDRDGVDSDDRETIEAKFMSVVQNMQISPLETAALRLAISRNDPAVRNALELFRASRNEKLLIASLREITRKTIKNTLEEANLELSPKPDDDEEEEEEDEDEDDGEDDEDSDEDAYESQKAPTKDTVPSDVTQVSSESESSSNGIMSSATRGQMFPLLISELVKEGIMRGPDGSALMRLFMNNNPVLQAALDVYDVEGDMAELADTMRKIASFELSSRSD